MLIAKTLGMRKLLTSNYNSNSFRNYKFLVVTNWSLTRTQFCFI